MRSRTSLILSASLCAGLLTASAFVFNPAKRFHAAADATTFAVETTTSVADVKPLGINLGNWTYWGAEQLMNNVLKNPGFEGLLDRAIVIVRRADAQSFSDDTEWLGRADGFWIDASFEVRTGVSAGAQGRIAASRKTGVDGLPEFTTEGAAPLLNAGDVISLTRRTDSALPTQWWYPPESTGFVVPELRDKRTGSSGQRALALKPVAGRTVEVLSYLDTITDRAGKLLPVNGAWRLSFWTKSCAGKPALNVQFRRAGSPAFLSRSIAPTSQWEKQTFDFTAKDDGPPGALELRFQATGDAACVLLDDVELGAVQSRPSPFREQVVSALRQLHPGYLRDWQGQLGDTLDNRLATSFARRASRYRPDVDGTDFGYSLPEFLDLCATIGASPWVVVPTTFTDEELTGLGRYLASQRRFEEILLEFGNENWNGMFRPAGISDPMAHGQAASRAFQKIRTAAGQRVRLQMAVNGQHANPEYALRFARYAEGANVLALGPYFQYSLMAGIPSSLWLPELFAGDDGRLASIAHEIKAQNKELAVYEVNLHTTEGTAFAAERLPVTAGAAAGSAVAKTMLDALTHGAQRQCAYTFAGFDSYLPNYSGLVRLWGVMRDVGDTRRFRPTGLAISMLNQVIAGDLMKVSQQVEAQATLYAFHSGSDWSAALISTSPLPQEITISFPRNAQLPAQLWRLDAPDPWATNETAEEVRIVKEPLSAEGNSVTVRLPAYGLVTLLPKERRRDD